MVQPKQVITRNEIGTQFASGESSFKRDIEREGGLRRPGQPRFGT